MKKENEAAQKRLKLLTKIFNVQQDVEILQKIHANEKQGYMYAKESDYINQIKPYLEAQKLVVIPTLLKTTVRDTSFTNSPAESALVEMTYLIADIENGGEIEVPISAAGKDQGDKAVAKALTMANKYFLAKTFQMETTTDDPENDRYNNEPVNKDAKKVTSRQPAKKDPAQMFIEASAAIKQIKNKTVAFTALEGIKNSTNYDAKQKEDLTKLISAKIDELDNRSAK